MVAQLTCKGPGFTGGFSRLVTGSVTITPKLLLLILTSLYLFIKEEERNQNEMDELNKATGFSKIIKKLTSSKKLVVGHNLMMDLCFMVNQFIAPLPESLHEFKQLLSQNLPYICDTKLMAKSTPFQEDIPETSLEELLKVLSQDKPFKMPQVESGMYNGRKNGVSTPKTGQSYC